jgi:tetratricopeptide (TPR) repeat protein
MRRPVLLVLLALGLPPAAGAGSFDEAMKAVAAGDDAAAFPHFEAALTAAPDDLRISNEYRQAVIRTGEYDRAIDFYGKLTAAHPRAAFAWLNYGYAYVDKIPAAGAITQVILANTSLKHFSRALELEETWLGRYTRGNAYVYWPAIFGRTPLGIEDLERAIALTETLEWRSYHAKAWVALGDGHWRLEDLERARDIWREGLERYPDDLDLAARLEPETDEELRAFLEVEYEIGQRVATHLREIFREDAPE